LLLPLLLRYWTKGVSSGLPKSLEPLLLDDRDDEF
jgi:hypothetical protein